MPETLVRLQGVLGAFENSTVNERLQRCQVLTRGYNIEFKNSFQRLSKIIEKPTGFYGVGESAY